MATPTKNLCAFQQVPEDTQNISTRAAVPVGNLCIQQVSEDAQNYKYQRGSARKEIYTFNVWSTNTDHGRSFLIKWVDLLHPPITYRAKGTPRGCWILHWTIRNIVSYKINLTQLNKNAKIKHVNIWTIRIEQTKDTMVYRLHVPRDKLHVPQGKVVRTLRQSMRCTYFEATNIYCARTSK